MRTTRLTALLTFVALAACQKAETPAQAEARRRAMDDSATTAIAAMATAYGQHFTAGHADSVAAIYAEDANVMPPNMPAVHGRDSIRAMMAGFFQQVPGATLTIRPEHVVANELGAVDRGRWVMTFAASSGMKADSGKYLATWSRRNGQWKMMNDMWSSDLPPAPMPPARHH